MDDVIRVLRTATFWDWQRLVLQLVALVLLIRVGGAIHTLLRTAQTDREASKAEIIRLRATADELARKTAIALGLNESVVSDLKEAATTATSEISDKLAALGQKIDVSAASSAEVTASHLVSATTAVTDAATTAKEEITHHLDAINGKLNIGAGQTKRAKKSRAKTS